MIAEKCISSSETTIAPSFIYSCNRLLPLTRRAPNEHANRSECTACKKLPDMDSVTLRFCTTRRAAESSISPEMVSPQVHELSVTMSVPCFVKTSLDEGQQHTDSTQPGKTKNSPFRSRLPGKKGWKNENFFQFRYALLTQGLVVLFLPRVDINCLRLGGRSEDNASRGCL